MASNEFKAADTIKVVKGSLSGFVGTGISPETAAELPSRKVPKALDESTAHWLVFDIQGRKVAVLLPPRNLRPANPPQGR